MRVVRIVSLVIVSLVVWSFAKGPEKRNSEVRPMGHQKDTKVAYFASGCFWCVEAVFESVRGVEEAVSGYAGGHTTNPTYQRIGTGRTGHAETVAVYYDPQKISYKTLVTVFLVLMTQLP